MKEILEADPPHGARVTFEPNWAASGWDAPEMAPWLERSLEAASRRYFGKPAAYMGEGGTIPFMGMLGERFPQRSFSYRGARDRNRMRTAPMSSCIFRRPSD